MSSSDVVMIDGEFVSPDGARVSVFDRGFLYGDSVFESLRTYQGQPFALDRHLTRLARSSERVLIPFPTTIEQLGAEVLSAIAVRGNEESYVRITLTRGVGRSLGLDPELALRPLRVVMVTALTPPATHLYEHGISAITFRAERPNEAPRVADAKIGHYLLAVLAMRAARDLGASEALIEDAHGKVFEGATSNLFAVRQGMLLTAPDNAPILAGITRAHVLVLASAMGLPVELRALDKLELSALDEVFVCSSLRELVPVVCIDGHPVGAGTPGPITRELLARYRRLASAAEPAL